MSKLSNEPIMEMFIFETVQLLEQLEQIIINSEKSKSYSSQNINEIFRIMHTIKGSSAMMMYDNISILAHSMEDLFYFIREKMPSSVDHSELTDLILKGADFIKTELAKIEKGKNSTGDSGILIDEIRIFLDNLRKTNSLSEQTYEKVEKIKLHDDISDNLADDLVKRNFKAVIYFEEDCKMENIRAFSIVHNIKDIASDVYYFPPDIVENNRTEEIIRKEGFQIIFSTACSIEKVREFIMQTIFLKYLEIKELDDEELKQIKKQMEKHEKFVSDNEEVNISKAEEGFPQMSEKEQEIETLSRSLNQSMISVNIQKLDKLMDLVGELVISEAMVTQNSDLQGLSLENFSKAAVQLKKITGELQDTVMSIRMVPLAATFQKMNRIVRDMSKKLEKNVQLEIIGEETEVDKNIIEHISDPLIHLIRNAVDHGIESAQERVSAGKVETGKITLEAKNSGGDVLVIIKDDGEGLDRDKILEKARKNGMITRPESDMTNREIFSFIFLPGFSTKDNVSEFSGRGVGMDVVAKNIEKIGGSVSVDSVPGEGTTVTIKIPLTLAIMDGMTIKVGKSTYTIPLINIKESLKVKESDIITDPEKNEMIMIRGKCYPILRLHELYRVKTEVTKISDGIIVMVENQAKSLCIFADRLIGEQQVVVKALPEYVKSFKKTRGIGGCTLLGDGSISLILDVAGLINY